MNVRRTAATRRIFAESGPYLESLLTDIRSARHRVWLETYTYVNDDAGRAVAEALKDRARAGLDVRLMVDAVGSFTTPESLFSDMAEKELAESQFRHPVRHARNPDAGHTIGFPYVPATVIRRPHAVSGLFMVYGGTPPGNARAAETSWQEVLAFLAQATTRLPS